MYFNFVAALINYYFWLCWVFIAALRLSLVVASSSYSGVVWGFLIDVQAQLLIPALLLFPPHL